MPRSAGTSTCRNEAVEEARTRLERRATSESRRYLSKSRYLSGRQCAKKLWIETLRPERLPPASVAAQARLDEGQIVGELARQLFPGGVHIDRRQLDGPAALAATREAMQFRVPLYEPAFEYQGAACRVDLLVPVPPEFPGGEEAWDLYEVKSALSEKDVNVEDVAFQTFVLRGAGVVLRRSHLVHLSSTYVREGELEIARLFRIVDLSAKIEPLLPELARRVADLQSVQARAEEPQVTIGPQCEAPYDCPLVATCWSGIPKESVFTLVRASRKKWDLFARGVVDLVAISDDFKLNAKQKIQVAAARCGEAHVDAPELRQFLSTLAYPLYYLDFETVAPAIPPFSGTRPHQAIPFQYSLHIVDRPHATPRAAAFLAEGAGDPRGDFLAALRRDMGEMEEGGTVVAFRSSVERSHLAKVAAHFPEHAEWAGRVDQRFVDLLVPFMKFAYYHPSQLGSASLKRVLPVLGARGYDGLEIQSGEIAPLEFVRSNLPSTSPEERDRIRDALLEYCGRDTEGMVEIVESLERIVSA